MLPFFLLYLGCNSSRWNQCVPLVQGTSRLRCVRSTPWLWGLLCTSLVPSATRCCPLHQAASVIGLCITVTFSVIFCLCVYTCINSEVLRVAKKQNQTALFLHHWTRLKFLKKYINIMRKGNDMGIVLVMCAMIRIKWPLTKISV